MNSLNLTQNPSLDTLARFRALFEAQKAQILSVRSVVDEAIQIQADDLMDEADLTGAELEASMRVRMKNRETLFLKKIDEALLRIREGSFGQCQSCDEAIELKRLEARPTTTLCLGCKEVSELKEHAHADGRKHKSLGSRIRLFG